VRSYLQILSDTDVDKIIDKSFTVLEKIGMHIGSTRVQKMIAIQEGAELSEDRILLKRDLVEKCLGTAPSEINIYRQDSSEPLILSGGNVHYVAGSVAPYIYDEKVQGLREPISKDLTEHIKL